jgi:hypothetical protein
VHALERDGATEVDAVSIPPSAVTPFATPGI